DDEVGVSGEAARRLEVATSRETTAVDGDEPSAEAPFVRREDTFDVPPARRAEPHPCALAVDDHPGGDALHAARRQPRHDLLPEHGRDLVAVEAIEDAARLLGIDEATVELAPLVDGALDGAGRDLVEHHPLHRQSGGR